MKARVQTTSQLQSIQEKMTAANAVAPRVLSGRPSDRDTFSPVVSERALRQSKPPRYGRRRPESSHHQKQTDQAHGKRKRILSACVVKRSQPASSQLAGAHLGISQNVPMVNLGQSRNMATTVISSQENPIQPTIRTSMQSTNHLSKAADGCNLLSVKNKLRRSQDIKAGLKEMMKSIDRQDPRVEWPRGLQDFMNATVSVEEKAQSSRPQRNLVKASGEFTTRRKNIEFSPVSSSAFQLQPNSTKVKKEVEITKGPATAQSSPKHLSPCKRSLKSSPDRMTVGSGHSTRFSSPYSKRSPNGRSTKFDGSLLQLQKMNDAELQDQKMKETLYMIMRTKLEPSDFPLLKKQLRSMKPYPIITAALSLACYCKENQIEPVIKCQFEDLLIKALRLPINHQHLHHHHVFDSLLKMQPDRQQILIKMKQVMSMAKETRDVEMYWQVISNNHTSQTVRDMELEGIILKTYHDYSHKSPKIRQKFAKILYTLKLTSSYEAYLVLIDIFKKSDWSPQSKEKPSPEQLEMLSHALFSIYQILKTAKIDFYRLLEPFLAQPSLSKYLISLLSANGNFKQLQTPAFKIIVKLLERVRNRLTQLSPQTTVLKYECQVGIKIEKYVLFPDEFKDYNLSQETREQMQKATDIRAQMLVNGLLPQVANMIIPRRQNRIQPSQMGLELLDNFLEEAVMVKEPSSDLLYEFSSKKLKSLDHLKQMSFFLNQAARKQRTSIVIKLYEQVLQQLVLINVEARNDVLLDSTGNAEHLASLISQMLAYLRGLSQGEWVPLKDLISRLQTHSQPEVYELATAFINQQQVRARKELELEQQQQAQLAKFGIRKSKTTAVQPQIKSQQKQKPMSEAAREKQKALATSKGALAAQAAEDLKNSEDQTTRLLENEDFENLLRKLRYQ